MKNEKYSTDRPYDRELFEKIKDIYLNNEPDKALRYIKQYIENYPKDEHAKSFYIRILISKRMFEEAREYINSLTMDEYDRSFQMFLIAYFTEDYTLAYELYPKIKDKIVNNEEYNRKYIKTFIENKLGLIDIKKDYDSLTYTEKQIVSYNEKRAINHIKLHKKEMENKEFHTLFEEEIDIEKLFCEVKKIIVDSEIVIHDDVVDIYIFEYPKIKNVIEGEEKQYKYLKIITIRDTKNIITMYPIFTAKRIDNINYFKVKNSKVKTMSRIDKFNKKYGVVAQ